MAPSLNVVRAFTIVITAAIWWVILYVAGWVFAGGGKVDHVSAVVIANLTAMSYLFIPYFVTEGTLAGMLGALLKKKLTLPDNTEDANARPSNPWVLGIINALIFGVLPAVIGYKVASGVANDTLTPVSFAVRYAWGGSLVVAIVAAFVSGRPFLKQTRVPAANRPFTGDVNTYLWTRFVLPHGIANFLINGALAFALSPVGATEVEGKVVVGDTVITLFVLTWLIASGVKGLAQADAGWGIASERFAADLNMPSAFLPCFFSGIGFSIVLGIGFAWFDVEGVSVTTWAVYRAVLFGAYCGWCAKRSAQAAINEVFHPEVCVPDPGGMRRRAAA